MSIEPSTATTAPSGVGRPSADSDATSDIDPSIVFAASTLPMLHALDVALDEDPAGLAQVLRVAETQSPGITVDLVAALAAEAEHLRRLTQRTEAAIARLRQAQPLPEPDAATADEVSSLA